jgi:hypothetical protein
MRVRPDSGVFRFLGHLIAGHPLEDLVFIEFFFGNYYYKCLGCGDSRIPKKRKLTLPKDPDEYPLSRGD